MYVCMYDVCMPLSVCQSVCPYVCVFMYVNYLILGHRRVVLHARTQLIDGDIPALVRVHRRKIKICDPRGHSAAREMLDLALQRDNA